MSDDENKDNVLPPDSDSEGDAANAPLNVSEINDGNIEKPKPYQFDEAALEDADDAELNRRGSSLGGGSSKAITLGAILLLGTGIILYYLFSDAPPPPPVTATGAVPTKPSNQSIPIASSEQPTTIGLPVPSAPTPPMPPAPPPPPPPPKPPAVVKPEGVAPPRPPAPLAPPEIKAIAPTENKAMDKRTAERMRSNMLLLNGGTAAPNDAQNNARNALNENDPNAEFASNAITASVAEKTAATKMSNLANLIAQGKIINAVLETAINTDLPGTLRAIISRDVYAEAGRNILIPKGSRLIGTYNTGILRGQKRIMIVWTRVITPTGVDIEIGSPAVDALGRAGVAGMVDNKYMETFSAALLTSMVTVGIAVAADGNIGGNSTTTSNTDGSTTSTGSSAANAVNSAVSNIGGVATQVVGDLLDIRPTITVDQGTRINVFVNKDLEFPGAETSGSLFVQ